MTVEGATKTIEAYRDFVRKKIKMAHMKGVPCELDEIHPALKPHQRDIVKWAVEGGQRAIFAAFGLGKTLMQLEIMRLLEAKTGGRTLIVCPLGVRQEFKRDAELIGTSVKFIRRTEEVEASNAKHFITNYESIRDGKLDVTLFNAISLDEASVLRSYGSKTYQEFLPLCSSVKYKFVATATPSPNSYKELIHYAGFLGIMDTGSALTRFFQRDSQKANNLTLYPHKEKEFWIWMHSWAVFLQKPSELGYSDEGYDLPELKVIYHMVERDGDTSADRDGQIKMFHEAALGLKEAATEKRETMTARVEVISKILHNISVDNSIEYGSDYCDGRTKSEEKSLLQGVVQEEQGGCFSKTENQREEELRGKSRGLQEKKSEMEGGKPREVQAVGEKLRGEEQGKSEAEKQGMVCCKQREGTFNSEKKQTGDTWSNAGTIRSDVHKPRREVCDLSRTVDVKQQKQDVCGPLSQDRDSPRTTLQPLQYGNRELAGQPGNTSQSDSILGELPEQIIIWCDLNEEQKRIESLLKEKGISFVSLKGDQNVDERERLIEKWKNNDACVFLSKPVLYGCGINMQQCRTMIFAGIGYKFQDFLQSLHRIHRFLQKRECHVHVIYSESEAEILRVLLQKWEEHKNLTARMSEIIATNGLYRLSTEPLMRDLGVERKVERGRGWEVALNDCVEEAVLKPDNSVGLVVTSIPFSNHYEYTPNYCDMGHTQDNSEFWEQMDFLTPELLRILEPGRMCCIHIKDRILFGNVTGAGAPTVSPLHAEGIFHYMKHGFDYMGMITVITDVVRENNQTYRLGWTENSKDGTKMGVGSPEYILLFRKPQTDRTRGYADVPVAKSKTDYTRARWQIDAHAFWRCSGDRLLRSDEFVNLNAGELGKQFRERTRDMIYDYDEHVKLGEAFEANGHLPATFMSIAPGSWHPDVWDDVNRMMTLNGEQVRRNLTMHVCPLQIEIVDRLIERYSNKGDLVYDPFGGLMTVPYRAVLLDRRGGASELNEDYFRDGVRYLRLADADKSIPTLFDDEELRDDDHLHGATKKVG